MRDYLIKFGLIDFLSLKLDIDKNKFIERLRHEVDEGSADLIGQYFRIFDSDKREYIGRVDSRGFEIRKRRKVLDVQYNIALAKGTFQPENDQLIIHIDINSWSKWITPFYLITLVFYLFFFLLLFVSSVKGDGSLVAFFSVPFILLHAVFMFSLPILLMKSSTRKMKRDLERDFYFFTKL